VLHHSGESRDIEAEFLQMDGLFAGSSLDSGLRRNDAYDVDSTARLLLKERIRLDRAVRSI